MVVEMVSFEEGLVVVGGGKFGGKYFVSMAGAEVEAVEASYLGKLLYREVELASAEGKKVAALVRKELN